MKTLSELKTGDEVTREMFGKPIMNLVVTAVTDEQIVCGTWTFCRLTGDEIDEVLEWRPGRTGSRIKPKETHGTERTGDSAKETPQGPA